MRCRNLAMLVGVAVLASAPSLLARQNIVGNGSMESGLGQGGPNPQIASDWMEFGLNVERSPEANQTEGGGFSLKAFGDPDHGSAGAYQKVSASPGQDVSVEAWLFTRTGDKLGGTGEAGIRLEFLDYFGGVIFGHTEEVESEIAQFLISKANRQKEIAS